MESRNTGFWNIDFEWSSGETVISAQNVANRLKIRQRMGKETCYLPFLDSENTPY